MRTGALRQHGAEPSPGRTASPPVVSPITAASPGCTSHLPPTHRRCLRGPELPFGRVTSRQRSVVRCSRSGAAQGPSRRQRALTPLCVLKATASSAAPVSSGARRRSATDRTVAARCPRRCCRIVHRPSWSIRTSTVPPGFRSVSGGQRGVSPGASMLHLTSTVDTRLAAVEVGVDRGRLGLAPTFQ